MENETKKSIGPECLPAEVNHGSGETDGAAGNVPLTDIPQEQPPESAKDMMTVGVDEVARLVAEAERNGYLRARNEMAARRMSEPELFSRTVMVQPDRAGYAVDGFLADLPGRVWD